jgi:2-keto-4-pentenoate hydratase
VPLSPQHSTLAVRLADSRRDARQVRELPTELVPLSTADAYAVNAMVAERLGWPQLGWKIAATTPEMQARLRTTEPIYGRTFRRFQVSSPATFDHAELLDPLVECEFFFTLARALPPRATPYTRDEVRDAIGACHAGVEVAECRFPLDRLPPVPAILADGAASGRYVMGPEITDWRTRDLATVPVTLAVDGAIRRRGAGRDVMGDPVAPLVWLANRRSAAGDGLAAGAMVSTGTTTGMLLARRGETMRATFGDEFVVELRFD